MILFLWSLLQIIEFAAIISYRKKILNQTRDFHLICHIPFANFIQLFFPSIKKIYEYVFHYVMFVK